MWFEFALAVLKFINLLMGALNREEWKKAGRDELATEILASIATKVGIRDQLRAKIDAMSDAEVDGELLRLGNARDVPPAH